MKVPKKKKLEPSEIEDDDSRPVRFEALEELTHSDIVAQVKNGLSQIDPLDHEDEFNDESAA